MKKLVAAALGVLVLTGCAGANPRMAAYVGDGTIPQARVDAVAGTLAAISPEPTDGPGEFRSTVLTIMVQSEIARKAAADKGITVTEAERQQVYNSNELYPKLVADPVTTEFMSGFADATVLVNSEAGRTAFVDTLGVTKVTVNPHFGEWDAAAGQLVPGSNGSISQPAQLLKG